jgi:hypothetical protein
VHLHELALDQLDVHQLALDQLDLDQLDDHVDRPRRPLHDLDDHAGIQHDQLLDEHLDLQPVGADHVQAARLDGTEVHVVRPGRLHDHHRAGVRLDVDRGPDDSRPAAAERIVIGCRRHGQLTGVEAGGGGDHRPTRSR